MAKVDTEIIFFQLKKFFQDNLPGVIAEINTEKNDAIIMIPPKSGSYVDLSLNSGVPNDDPFVFSWIESIPNQSRGSAVAKEIRIEILIFKAVTGEPAENIMGLRYMRAMEETAQKAWKDCFKGRNLEIQSLTPVDIQLINSTEYHRVYGVALIVSLS